MRGLPARLGEAAEPGSGVRERPRPGRAREALGMLRPCSLSGTG